MGATLLSTHILLKTQKLRNIELQKQQKRIRKEYLLWHPCHPRRKAPLQWPCVDVSSGSGEAAFSLATNDTSWPPSPAADTPHSPLAMDLPPYRLKTALRTDNNCMSQQRQKLHIMKSISLEEGISSQSNVPVSLVAYNSLYLYCAQNKSFLYTMHRLN